MSTRVTKQTMLSAKKHSLRGESSLEDKMADKVFGRREVLAKNYWNLLRNLSPSLKEIKDEN